MESMLQGIGHLLRLEAVTLQALPCFEAAALSGFRVLFDVSCGAAHGVLLDSVGILWRSQCTHAHVLREWRLLCATCFRTSCFPLPAICSTYVP